MVQIMPFIEQNIPIPENAREAFPTLSASAELEMRANVVKLLSDLTGENILPDAEQAEEARQLAQEMISNPRFKPQFSRYPNETIAMLAGMVSQMNVAIVDELSDLKMYVVNKLISEIENSKDPRVRVSALSKLGEIDGIDAFKKRSEVTHKHLSIEEVEAELIGTLERLENKVIDIEAKEVVAATYEEEAGDDEADSDS
jgi:undecaprenyl pyrophosphate synthase